jgi:hypothetical protein
MVLWFAVASENERIRNKRMLDDIERALISSEAESMRGKLEKVKSILLAPRGRLPPPLKVSLDSLLI